MGIWFSTKGKKTKIRFFFIPSFITHINFLQFCLIKLVIIENINILWKFLNNKSVSKIKT